LLNEAFEEIDLGLLPIRHYHRHLTL